MTQNPPELPQICRSVAERSSRILGDFAQKQMEGLSSAVRDEMGIARAFMDLYARMAADPLLVANCRSRFGATTCASGSPRG